MVLKSLKAALAVGAFLVIAATGWIVRALSAPAGAGPGPNAPGAFFEVEKGWRARVVIDRLAGAGLVRAALPLRLACRLFYPGQSFKAGEYLLAPPLTAKAALFKIFGGRIHLEPVTVPEGLTADEIAALLRPADAAGAEAFRRAALDPTLIADLDPRARDLEGYLFPETYNLPRRAPEADIVAAMVGRFREIFDEPRRRRAAEIGLSLRDVVTLASLIEEETGLAEERPLVSAVFHNRLKIGMKLDCDPTVVYALKRQGLYRGRLLLKDLLFPSPYNTYLHAGLPPGPISNPGLASLDAALGPAAESYLYFVARGDGTHRFSRTLGEHLDAVKKLRALQKH
jgi:peptidoglycan lytic transglycosylase G